MCYFLDTTTYNLLKNTCLETYLFLKRFCGKKTSKEQNFKRYLWTKRNIWDALHDLAHLYNLKNMKNTYEEVLLLVASLLHGWLLRFLNCANNTKSWKASQ